MEVDFDKEIDALLRKARHSGPVLVGDAAGKHLDADEIAAFAENALPEKSHAVYTMHFAECDRCRKILSNLLVMNSEAVPVTASPSVITIAERDLPWYRKLLLFPNLAYLMGGLVLIFGGFLAFTVMQQSLGGREAVVSQVSDDDPRRGDTRLQSNAQASESALSSSNAAANTAVGSAQMTANANAASRPLEPEVSGPRTGDTNFSADGVAASDAPAPAAPPPAAVMQPAPREVRERDDSAEKEKTEARPASGATLTDSTKNDLALKQRAIDTNTSGAGGPLRNESQYQRQLENLDRKSAASAKRAATGNSDDESSGQRVIAGRRFERKQGVWYDAAYQGRPTINVRRGTAEFQRLDGGLRSIADSLSGTIVVVWGAKAYRIQ